MTDPKAVILISLGRTYQVEFKGDHVWSVRVLAKRGGQRASRYWIRVLDHGQPARSDRMRQVVKDAMEFRYGP